MKRRWSSGVSIADLSKITAAMQVALKACTATPLEMHECSFSALELSNVSAARTELNAVAAGTGKKNRAKICIERYLILLKGPGMRYVASAFH